MRRRIPTIIGLGLTVFLVFGVAITTLGLQRLTNWFAKASPTAPENSFLGTANITDTGFAVYWVTTGEAAGAVYYGKTPRLDEGIAVDIREAAPSSGRYATHYVRVANLKPATRYYFQVSNDGRKAGAKPEEVTTAARPAEESEPLFGVVLTAAATPVRGAIVVWESEEKERIAALSSGDGAYVLPVGKTASGKPATITFFSSEGRATLTCRRGFERNLPAVKIGETLDCQTAAAGGGFRPLPEAATPAAVGGELKVSLSDRETVVTPLPTIAGRAGPNQSVKITIESDLVYSATVMADPAGNWSWTPPSDLSPGEHTVTITVTNPDGSVQTVKRTFFVTPNSLILPITSGTPSGEAAVHQACVNQACVTVAGGGSDSCLGDSDCKVPPSSPSPPPPSPSPLPVSGRWEITTVLLLSGLFSITLGGGVSLWRNRRVFPRHQQAVS